MAVRFASNSMGWHTCIGGDVWPGAGIPQLATARSVAHAS